MNFMSQTAALANVNKPKFNSALKQNTHFFPI